MVWDDLIPDYLPFLLFIKYDYHSMTHMNDIWMTMLQILWSKSRNLFFVTIIDIVMSYKTHCKVSLWHILVLLRLLIKSANITLWYHTNAFGSVTSLWTTMSVCRSYCLPAVCLYVCLSVSRYVCLSVGLSKKKSKFFKCLNFR